MLPRDASCAADREPSRSRTRRLSVAIVWDVSASMEHVMPWPAKPSPPSWPPPTRRTSFRWLPCDGPPELRLAFARRAEDVLQTMDHTSAGGNTALLDAVYLAASTLREPAHNSRKAMLVVSDGDDNQQPLHGTGAAGGSCRSPRPTSTRLGVGVRQPEMSPDGGPPERVGSEILTSLAGRVGRPLPSRAADPRELPRP